MEIQEAIEDMEERFVEVGVHEHPDKILTRLRSSAIIPKSKSFLYGHGS
jgi:hypothetical protein